MSYSYSNTDLWRKKARGSLIHGITSLVPAGVSLYLNGRVDTIIVFLSVVVCLLGLWQMVHLYRMPERDYVTIEEDVLDIRHGIADPNARIEDEQIQRIQQIDDVLSIRLECGEEETIYLEYLSREDREFLMNDLKQQYGMRMNRTVHFA